MKYFDLYKQADNPYYRQKIRSLPKNEETKQRLELFNHIKRMPQATVQVFHGTSENIWNSIKQTGYFTSPNQRNVGHRERRTRGLDEVFFTTSLPYADLYAQRSAEQNQSDPVMIVLEIPIYYFIEVSSIILGIVGEETYNIFNSMGIQFEINDIITKEDTINQKAQAVVAYMKNWMQTAQMNEFTVKHALPLKFVKSVYNIAKNQDVSFSDNRQRMDFEHIKSSLPYFADQEKLLDAMKSNVNVLKFAPKELLYDRNFMLKAVKQKVEALHYASEQLKNDKYFVLEAVQQNGEAFQYASEQLRNDKQFMLEVVKQNRKAFHHAPKHLQNDKEIVLEVVKQDVEALGYIPEHLRNDKEVALEAVKQNGFTLQLVPLHLRNDKEVVLEAVNQNGLALEGVEGELRNDRKVVIKAVKQNALALQFAPEHFRNDKQFVLYAVKQNGLALAFASDELKNDKKVVLEAVKKDGNALYSAYNFTNDTEVVLQAVKQNGKALRYASEELKNDRKVVIEAVKQNGFALQYAALELSYDPDIQAIVNQKKTQASGWYQRIKLSFARK